MTEWLPGPWIGVVLALAAYRLTRLAGWDDFPPIYRIRAWVLGETWVPLVYPAESAPEPLSAPDPGLPGKTPTSEVQDVRPAYKRPTLAHLVHCPFCIGWWISVTVYGVWLLDATVATVIAVPFAVSGIVGVIAKNLDA